MQPKTTKTEELEATFNELVKIWHKETDYYSFTDKVVGHPAYRQIIEMGQPVLPLIFREMEQNGGDWFEALRILTGANPFREEMRGKVIAREKAWLEWAKEHGYEW